MEKMLVVVFENEAKAYEGARALNQLDTEGSIAIHAEAVIKKNADRTVSVLQSDGEFPVRTIGGTAIGSLIGVLGGPVGLAIGAVAGSFAACWATCTLRESTRISALTLPLPLSLANTP